MPIELPNLDDRPYEDLVREAIASIPASYPGWTDHNPSDPGITLIELFAWVSEAVLYRTNQIPDANYHAFLRLLSGPSWTPPVGQDLDTIIHDTMRALRERVRAVTPADYEALVTAQRPDARRVRAVAERDLTAAGHEDDPAPAHMSVVVLLDPADPQDPWAPPPQSTLDAILAFLSPRRLLTTRLHVVGPVALPVTVTAELYLNDDAVPAAVKQGAADAVAARHHPITGGDLGEGWPFGRSLYASDLYTLLDDLRGVDFARNLDVAVADPSRRLLNADGTLAGVALRRFELPRVTATPAGFTTLKRIGDGWMQVT